MSVRGDIWPSEGRPPEGWPPGWDVRHVAETGSTNVDLLDALERGDAGDRTVLATDHQTAGRGRLDRRWDAPPGTNLLVSIAVAPVPPVVASATHRVGVAAVRAVRGLRPDANVALKWPNDVLLDGEKLAGILAQRSGVVDAAVVGLGLNVGWAPEGAARVGDDHRPSEVLRRVLVELDAIGAEPLPDYVAELSTVGREVRLHLPDGSTVVGRALAVDGAGRLAVDDGSGVRHFDVADVVHLR